MLTFRFAVTAGTTTLANGSKCPTMKSYSAKKKRRPGKRKRKPRRMKKLTKERKLLSMKFSASRISFFYSMASLFYTHIPFLLLFNAWYIPSTHHVFSLDQKAKRASQAFLFVFHHGRVLIFFFLICSTADTGRVSVSRSLPVHSWIPVLFNEFMSKTRRVRQWGVSKAVFLLFPHRI